MVYKETLDFNPVEFPGKEIQINYKPETISEAVGFLEEQLLRKAGPYNDGSLVDVVISINIGRDKHFPVGVNGAQPSICTRPAPHLCRTNGPCNGYPKDSTQETQ